MNIVNDKPLDVGINKHQSIAKVISDLASKPPDERSLIIGIHGPWGSGKTSVLHLAMEEAAQKGIPQKHLIKFEAWKVQPENFIESYFAELASSLGLVVNYQVIELLEKYAQTLRRSGVLAEKILEGLSRLLNVISLLGVGLVSFFESPIIKSVVLATALAIHLAGPMLFGASWTVNVTKKYIQHYQNKRNSIRSLKAKVNKILSDTKEPIIIALDHIDRVQPYLVKEILEFTKKNAHFSNITFLLLMDEIYVANALGDGDLEAGKMYLEKMVNISIRLD